MLELIMNRDDAWALLTEYTKSESLRKHALGVEAAVRGYARRFGEDEEAWGITALLHDFDYERWPTLGDHPNKGAEVLREKGYPEVVIRAILLHAQEITGASRGSRLQKRQFARAEVAAFTTAAATAGWGGRCTPATSSPASPPPRRWSGRARASSISERSRWSSG